VKFQVMKSTSALKKEFLEDLKLNQRGKFLVVEVTEDQEFPSWSAKLKKGDRGIMLAAGEMRLVDFTDGTDVPLSNFKSNKRHTVIFHRDSDLKYKPVGRTDFK
jgi:hypothetical protein